MTVDTGSANPCPSTQPLQRQNGIVIAHFGSRLLVETGDGQQRECHSRKNAGPLVAGDRVVVQTETSDSVVLERQPRHTELSRPDSRGKARIIAANIDQMLIVIAPSPPFRSGLLERYLVAAELSGITPVIVHNKTDLLGADELASLKQELAVYTQIGYPVVFVSTHPPDGLEPLVQILSGRNNIVVGQSGVGKSSLINHLLPGVDARVGDVSAATSKGTHTTTTARLYHLPDNQGNIIDSPGVREFGLWQVGPADLSAGFREFADYRPHCKFRDCLHRQEPGCAVRQAVDSGEISTQRYTNYLKLLESVEQGRF